MSVYVSIPSPIPEAYVLLMVSPVGEYSLQARRTAEVDLFV